jgi:hypothetical protein
MKSCMTSLNLKTNRSYRLDRQLSREATIQRGNYPERQLSREATMAYGCELSDGQYLYLNNLGTQTSITLSSSTAGQQQQSSQMMQTGEWTTMPEVFRVDRGVVVKLHIALGERFVCIQGGSIRVLSQPPNLGNAQLLQVQLTADPAMNLSMQPMRMGDMKMGLKPMSMRMGNLSMQMGMPAPPTSHRFCSQCGTATQSSDRFCSSCGHQLAR